MRKLLIAIMAALMLAFPLSASISSDPAFLRVRGLEMPVSARMAGMGMAGISSVKGYDALNYNPAALADSGFTLTLPYVNVTLYNTASMLTSGIIDAALALPGATEENQQELADALMDSADIFAQSLGTYNKVANIEAGVGFTAGGFGFNFYIIDSVHSYNAGAGSLASLSLINRLNAAISIGYGHRISFPYGYSLDIGAAVRFSYLAFTETIGAASLMSDLNGMLNTTPMYYGWAVPIDIAVRGNFPLGFSTTVALRNINGFYYMNQAPISSWAGDLFAFGNIETVYTPMSLDVGVSWTYDDIWWFHPTIAIDFVDLIGFKDDPAFDFRTIAKHVNLGIELGFLDDHLVIRGGLSQGYLSAGIGVDLWALKIDAAYYWREFGMVAGSKGVDALTVRLTIGWGPGA